MQDKTNIVYFKEYERFYSEKIENLFSNEKIKNLFVENILKSDGGKTYYFQYVGIICSDNYICVVLPKYLSKEEIDKERLGKRQHKTEILIKVLQTYNLKNLTEEFLSITGDEEVTQDIDKFAIYDYLISDFIEYGLYENHKNIYEVNGEGEIDWEKTVNECESFLTGKVKPIYLEYFTHETESDNSSYIRTLHKHYLNKSSLYFEKLKFLGLDYPILSFQVEEEELGNLEFQIFKIYQELQGEFSERKIRLLKTLLILLENETHEIEKAFSFYGTKVFYNVWEKACGEVLGNEYQKYSSHIDKPIWKAKGSDGFKVKTLIPDILVLRDETFYIFDAKYYNTDIEKKKNLIEIEYITKQYFYELAFENHKELLEKRRKNIFLIPSNEKEIEYKGKVSLEFLKKVGRNGLQDILIYSLPAEEIFKRYVENRVFSKENFDDFEEQE
ncbi:MAG: LlaJI family restriction endonuclease [Fusobacteriaceae bacterium]